MTISKSNVLNGLCIIAFCGVLYMQTLGMEEGFVTEGIHPMDYPRFLIWVLAFLGLGIAIKPGKDGQSEEPSFPVTRRTPLMIAALVLYAILFETTGFFISSVVGAACCALVMGWRRYGMLALVTLSGITIIWVLFSFLLKIPLPAPSWL